MLEHFGATVRLYTQYPAQELRVQLWTNALTKLNPKGDWQAIELEGQFQESSDTWLFQGSFMPTSEGDYQFTYRIGLNNHQNQWQWAGGFQENGYLNVKLPSPSMTWTQGPSCVEVLPHVSFMWATLSLCLKRPNWE